MLYMGIPYELCGKLNPRLLKPFVAAKKKHDESIDTQNWMLGSYVSEAVGVVISNAFGKKGSKKLSYRDKPYHVEQEERAIETGEKQLTREERAIRVKKIFDAINASLTAQSPEVRKKGD